MRAKAGIVVAAGAFWIFVTALYAAQIVWLASQPGERINLWTALVWQGGFFLAWIPVTVLIWNVTPAWSPATLGWARYLVRHLTLAATVAIGHSLIVMGLAAAILGVQGESIGQMLIGQLRGRGYFEALIYAGVAAAGHAMWLYDQWRARETQAAQLESQLAGAQLATLQAQIHPHFLFNSLHAIGSLARENRNADVVKLVADLSELLRRVMEPQAPLLPLSVEVDLARRYLDIQQVRFERRLVVEMDIDPATLDRRVPALTLQPLVDNAVRHGIAPSVRGGTVSIRASLRDNALHLHVHDDGEGPPAAWSPSTTSGTGLANLRARLALLFGDRAQLHADRDTNGGFSVTVIVPPELIAPHDDDESKMESTGRR